jgi:tetratricopeptide (TPR) repeat protein
VSAKVVFISHSAKDGRVVAEIRQALESLGMEIWTDVQADVQAPAGGDKLSPAITAAIERATHFLAIMGPNAVNAPLVRIEIAHALKAGKRVIPVMLPGVEPAASPFWFAEEPVAVKIAVAPGGVAAALPHLLAALGEFPAAPEAALVPSAAPIADLVLVLTDPTLDHSEDRRHPTATASLQFQPPEGGPRVESGRYRFTAPIGPIEAGELTWYLERYIMWPSGIFMERARGLEQALPRWGRLLYDALDSATAREVVRAWRAAPSSTERRFTVTIYKEPGAGAPRERQLEPEEAAARLLSLPWELIHDETGYLFQGSQPAAVRRRLPSRSPSPTPATPHPIRVLLVSPRPEDESAAYVDHRASVRPVLEALTRLGDLAEFKILDPPTLPALELELERASSAKEPYHIIHFDGYGVYDPRQGFGALAFEDASDQDRIEGRRSSLASADEIASVVRWHRVPLFFLDTCQSAATAVELSTGVAGKLLESGVGSVVAMSHSLLVEAAQRFGSAFYVELMNGKRVGQAMLAGQRALKIDTFRGRFFDADLRLEDWFVPVLFQDELDPQLIRETPAEAVQAIVARRTEFALGDIPGEPSHSFIGRGPELLKAERILARERYLVIQGPGGEGKTTLASELARWLVFTRRFGRAAFVRIDQDGDARRILFELGSQLVPNYASRAALNADLARRLVERVLEQQPTLIVLDNMESALSPAPGSEAALGFEPETLDAILELFRDLARISGTRLIFTTREPLPEPFARNVLRIGRLGRSDAIRIVSLMSSVWGERKLEWHAADTPESQEELEKLVDAAGCHARSVVLLANEAVASGVRNTTESLQNLMARLEANHPGDPDRSLLASVELSLRRLPPKTRRLIQPLSLFQGGGTMAAIGLALNLEPEQLRAFISELVNVGLAELDTFGYLRFDPALMRGNWFQERAAARDAWAGAIAAEVDFLDRWKFEDASLAHNVARLDLPNLMAALEYLAAVEAPERVVALATRLEDLIANLNRPKALARLAEIRTAAAHAMGHWNHAAFLAERAAIERLMEQGRLKDAVGVAHALFEKTRVAGEIAYQEAAYDCAVAQFTLARALRRNGTADEALTHLDDARRGFERLGDLRMSNAALTDKADCLRDLGRYDEAAVAHGEAIDLDEQWGDTRGAAVGRSQLAAVRMLQARYAEALELYRDALQSFKQLGEARSVAVVWHQIGVAYGHIGRYAEAEKAAQKSLIIRVQMGDQTGEAATLNQLGNLYSQLGRTEEALRLYREAAKVFGALKDSWDEAIVRNNLAFQLIRLKRHDEARTELQRAIECAPIFEGAAEPRKMLDIFGDLERTVANEAAAPQARTKNPYPGLRPFEADDAECFFGRDRHVDELLLRLHDHRFVAVLGLSGFGKSSLVRAGLIPALKAGHLTSSGSSWRVALFRPGSQPLEALAAALDEALAPEPNRLASLRTSTNALLLNTRSGRESDESLLVVVDQFEELFRVSNGRDAAHFVDLLLAAEQDISPKFRVYVILTMRTDRLGECAQFESLPEALSRSMYLVPRLADEQLREAMEGPAALTDVALAPELVQKLAIEASEGRDQLPLLQHMMMTLWERQGAAHDGSPWISLADYEAVGTAAAALNNHADRVLGELPQSRQHLAALIFRALTEAGEDRRRPLRLSRLAEVTGAAPEDVRSTVEHFRAANFLTSPDRSRTQDWEVHIAHECLIRQWRKLAGWIAEETRDAEEYGYLATRVQRGADVLTGRDLQSAINWLETGHTVAWAARYSGHFDAVVRYIEESRQEARKEGARRRGDFY